MNNLKKGSMQKPWVLLLIICSFFLFSFAHFGKEKKRNELPSKKQGIILNIPADAIVVEPIWGGDTSKNKDQAIRAVSKEHIIRTLNSLIDKYSGTQVTKLFFNVNYQRACFDSKVMESYWNLKNPEAHMTEWPRGHWEIHKKGIDPFAVCIARSRHNNISPWVSIRMNDHHYFNDSTRINKLWWNHPEYRRSQYGMFNYAKKEVRDYYKAFIKEVLDRYDVDGIELDWMRTNSLFLKGEEVEGVKVINQFMREIGAMAKQKSLERGHPVRIAARVPSTPVIGKSFGLDGVSWAKENLVDILIPSNWFIPTNFDIPVELWKKEIGDKSKCLLVPGADCGHCIAKNKYIKQMGNNVETMRGFSVSTYSRGADGIYLFNHFLPTYKLKIISSDGTINYTDDKKNVLKEVGELSTALGKPRSHVYTYAEPDAKPLPSGALPLLKDKVNDFMIHSGPKPGKSENYIIRIGLESKKGFENAGLSVTLNNKLCKQIEDMPRDPSYKYNTTTVWHIVKGVSETGARVMQFEADLKSVVDGHNQISVVNTRDEEQAVTWLDVYID